MLEGKSSRNFRKQKKTAQDAWGKEVQTQAKKGIARLRRRLEADGAAEALRSFVRAAIAQSPGEKDQ